MTTPVAPRASSATPALAVLSFVAALALFWPGIAEYDSVLQYGQALAGRYDDWHPPAMARLWAILIAMIGPGAAPMLVVQLGGYAIGFGLIAAALARAGRSKAALAIPVVAWWPPFIGWQAVILKDAQAVAAMLASVGIVAWYRLSDRRVPWGWRATIVPLLLYALLARTNTVFAVAPLVAGLPRHAGIARRTGIAVAIVAATLALSPVVNHRLLGAASSGVEKTQPFYDLAGIAARTGGAATGFTPAEARMLVAHRCVTPFFWDRLGDAPGCGPTTRRLWHASPAVLYRAWAAAVMAHPGAYALHRIAHLNSTDRWWVPARWPGGGPPGGSEPNDVGLAQPGAGATAWQKLAGWLTETPAGWPVAWIALAAVTLIAGRRSPGPAAVLARALLASALTLEASFAVVSIASDLRYHLWSMIATALALILLGRAPWHRRWRVALVILLAVVIGIGGVARATLPRPPQAYEEWIA